jgi:hypothetical protein
MPPLLPPDAIKETVKSTLQILHDGLHPVPLADADPPLDDELLGLQVPVPVATPMTQAERTALITYIGTTPGYTPIGTKPAAGSAPPVASNILKALHLFGKEHSQKLISDDAAGTTAVSRQALGDRVAAMAALKHDTTGVHPTKGGPPLAPMLQPTIENHLKKLIPELDSTVPVLGVTAAQANDALTNAHILLTRDSDANRIAGMVNIIAGVSEWQTIKATMVGGNRRRKSRKARKARKARKSRRSRRSRKSRKSRNYRRARMMV